MKKRGEAKFKKYRPPKIRQAVLENKKPLLATCHRITEAEPDGPDSRIIPNGDASQAADKPVGRS